MNHKDSELQKNMRKYLRWTKFLDFLLASSVRRKYNFVTECAALPEGANLILANHVTKADQFLVGLHFHSHHIFYVSGENVFRNRLFRWFVKDKLGVIIHTRGMTSLSTIKMMTTRLKEGGNVVIFPEGAMTFDGRTKAVDASIAKVARMSGANLVLVKIHGGYLSQPRWGKSVRKGQVSVSEYVISRDDLKNMSAQEISDTINERIFVDDYEDQKKNRISFVGKNKCEGLEACLYLCPECKEITGLKTKNESIFCKCGYKMSYDDYGYLTDVNGRVRTVSELCDLQLEHLKKLYLEAKLNGRTDYLFKDEVECKKVFNDGREVYIGKIVIEVYADHIAYEKDKEKKVIGLDTIRNVFVILRNTLNCVVAGMDCTIEFRGDFSFNALKYKDFIDIVKSDSD